MAAWRLAGSPTSFWPSLVNATKDGKAFPLETPAPSALGITTGRPPSITDAAAVNVPISIPISFDIIPLPNFVKQNLTPSRYGFYHQAARDYFLDGFFATFTLAGLMTRPLKVYPF